MKVIFLDVDGVPSFHLVRTSPYRGLGAREVERALRMLGAAQEDGC